MSFWNKFERWPDRHYAITPSDVTNLPTLMTVFVNGAGNVALVDRYNTVITYAAVAGDTLPVLAKRINSTGTTATGLVGLT